MLKLALLAIAFLLMVTVAVTLIITALICVALVCAIGIPLYMLSHRWMLRNGLVDSSASPMDRVKALYVEGKIDLFEFERRVARLISVEH